MCFSTANALEGGRRDMGVEREREEEGESGTTGPPGTGGKVDSSSAPAADEDAGILVSAAELAATCRRKGKDNERGKRERMEPRPHLGLAARMTVRLLPQQMVPPAPWSLHHARNHIRL